MGMREASKYRCGDCGIDVGQGGLIVSTVVGTAASEALCCTVDPACMGGFLRRAHQVFGAPIQVHGGGYAEVFLDDNHFTKISPSSGAFTHAVT